jgi:HlyD family secretion protein
VFFVELKIRAMRYYLSILFTLSIILISCKEKESGIKPIYRNITEAVYSTVTVKPHEIYTVFSSVNGILEASNLEEGKIVKKDEILVKIKNPQSKISSSNAKLNYEIIKQNYEGDATILQEIRGKINSANIKLKVDSLNFTRQKRLWSQNIGSLQSFEAMKLKYEVTVNEVKSLNNQYRRTQNELQKQVQQAKNNYQISNINQEDFIVKSKLDGTIYQVFKEKGESINTQSPIAIVGSTDSFLLYLMIDEVDITKVYEGQLIEIVLDAYLDRTFKAKLSRINPTKDEITHTFTVEAQFIESPSRLFNGLSGEANIIISTKQKILTLPTQYINEDQKVNTDNGLVSVKTGMKTLKYTEIISGIDTSTIIYQLEP